MVLEGKAAATSIDLTRVRFMPRCFTWPKIVPLLYRHADPAGDVDDLYYSSAGELMARVTASHALARRAPAFSISANVREWRLVKKDTADFYAEVLSATITELSLTPSPCNPDCRVVKREPVPQAEQSFVAMNAKLKDMMKLAEGMRCSI